jgi:predicted nucleic acid-binding protein
MPEPKAVIESNILLYFETQDKGRVVAERYGMSMAAALLGGRKILCSEDMQDGLSIDNQLHIRNPFATRALSGLRDPDA